MRRFTKFNKILVVTISSITILILVFIFLNSFTHPRVTNINVLGGIDSAFIKNQQIKIDFNRPIKKDGIEKFIKITPEIKFRSIWSANTLILIPSTTLDSQTDYSIDIDKNIQDVYGENFVENFQYKFTTEIPQFAFIQKDSGSNWNTIVTYNADFTNRQEIIKRDNIKFYGINSNYVVIVTENNYSNNIEIFNRKNNTSKSFNLENININAFSFSPSNNKNEFAYTKQDIEVKPNYYIPKSQSKIHIYNIDSQTDVIFNPKNTADDISAIKFSSDGNSLLYKSGDSFYNLAEIANPDNLTTIGRYLSEGNFNKDNNSILFLNYDPLYADSSSPFITIFNSDRNSTKIDNKNIAVIDPQFFHRTDEIIYAQKFREVISTKGIYKIMKTDLEGNKQEVISIPEYSLEIPKLSYDDRYISVEQYTEEELKDYQDIRNLGFQNKPTKGYIVILDTKTNKVIKSDVTGSDVEWF